LNSDLFPDKTIKQMKEFQKLNWGKNGIPQSKTDLEEIKAWLTYQRDFQLLELSEPTWCVYHAKIATRYMCGAGGNTNIQEAKRSFRN